MRRVKMTQKIELADKNIKTVILTALHMFKKLENRLCIKYRKKIETPNEFLEIKMTISEVKNSLYVIINRLGIA